MSEAALNSTTMVHLNMLYNGLGVVPTYFCILPNTFSAVVFHTCKLPIFVNLQQSQCVGFDFVQSINYQYPL